MSDAETTKGRPKSRYGTKKNRSLYITDDAYDFLSQLATRSKATNISDLIEKLARSEVRLEEEDDLHLEWGDIEIFWRIRDFFQKPAAAYESTMAFTFRLAGQLGLPIEEEFLLDIVERATRVIFFQGYLTPDQYIDSISGWLRWHILHLLQDRANKPNASNDNETDRFGHSSLTSEESIDRCIQVVYNARKKLQENPTTTPLQALKLKMHDCTIGQINHVFKFQGATLSGTQLLKAGLSLFRKLCFEYQKDLDEIPIKEKRRISDAFKYCRIAYKKKISDSEILVLTELVKDGLKRPDYDFWATEIDYFLELKFARKTDFSQEISNRIRQRIENTFDINFLAIKEGIENELLYESKEMYLLSKLLEKRARKEFSCEKDIFHNNIPNILNPIKKGQ